MRDDDIFAGMADDIIVNDTVHHTVEMDRDLAQNFLDFVQHEQTEDDGMTSHARLYDSVHHHKVSTYWAAAKQAHSAVVNGMRNYDPHAFTKWKPSEQLFKVMKDEMASRMLPPFTPKRPVVRKRPNP